MVAVRDCRYFILAALAFVLARFAGGPLPYFLLYVFGGILVVSYVWASALDRNLTLSYDLDRRRISAGQTVNARLRLYNEGFFPLPWATVTDQFAAGMSGEGYPALTFSLGPLGSAVASYPLACRRRGHYLPGPVELVTGDPFGIFRVRLNFSGSNHLTVYPRLVVLDQLPIPPRQPYGPLRTRQRAFEDPSSPAEVRPLRPGDNPRRIHWRTSARLGRLHVVEYELTATTQVHIFLDLEAAAGGEARAGGPRPEDTGVEVALAIAHYALRQGFSAGLVAHGSERLAIPAGKGLRKFQEYLEALARASAGGRVPLAEVLALESRHLPPRSTIAVITPSLAPNLVTLLMRLVRTGFGVLLFVVQPRRAAGPPGPAATDNLRRAGIDVRVLASTEDLLAVGGKPYAARR